MPDDVQRAEQTQELLQVEGEFRHLLPHMTPEELLSGYKQMLSFVAAERIRAKLLCAKEETPAAKQHRLTIYAIEQEMLRRMSK